MRLTLSVDPRRGSLRVHTDHALHYPGAHVAHVVAAAVGRAVEQLLGNTDPHRGTDQLPGDQVSTPPIPPQRPDPDHPLPTRSPHAADREPPGKCDEEVTRRRVLRLLEGGHTVAAVAEQLGVDPELIDRWDDDAATDARIDLLAAGLTGLAHPARAQGRWGRWG